MERSYFITLCSCAIDGLLYSSLCRTPPYNSDCGMLVSIALRPGQFFCGSVELAESFLHHSHMVFRFIVRMPRLVMFQPGSYISHGARPGSADGGDTTRS